jgi:hypothetical protein
MPNISESTDMLGKNRIAETKFLLQNPKFRLFQWSE